MIIWHSGNSEKPLKVLHVRIGIRIKKQFSKQETYRNHNVYAVFRVRVETMCVCVCLWFLFVSLELNK